jgi:hypothetical protein
MSTTSELHSIRFIPLLILNLDEEHVRTNFKTASTIE